MTDFRVLDDRPRGWTIYSPTIGEYGKGPYKNRADAELECSALNMDLRRMMRGWAEEDSRIAFRRSMVVLAVLIVAVPAVFLFASTWASVMADLFPRPTTSERTGP